MRPTSARQTPTTHASAGFGQSESLAQFVWHVPLMQMPAGHWSLKVHCTGFGAGASMQKPLTHSCAVPH